MCALKSSWSIPFPDGLTGTPGYDEAFHGLVVDPLRGSAVSGAGLGHDDLSRQVRPERNWGGDYYTGTEGSSVLLDPWHLIVGTASRTGLGVETTIAVVAVVQLIAVLIAIRAFARRLVTWQWARPCFLVATLLFWGYQPWRWSGFLDLNGLGFVISYPSTGATAAMLFGTVSLDRWVTRHTTTQDGSRSDLPLTLVCAGVVAAWSPMTLLPAATLAAAVAASRPTRLRWHRVAALGGWEQQPSSGS